MYRALTSSSRALAQRAVRSTLTFTRYDELFRVYFQRIFRNISSLSSTDPEAGAVGYVTHE